MRTRMIALTIIDKKEEIGVVEDVKQEGQPSEAGANEDVVEEEIKDDTPLKPHQIYANV